MATIVASFGGDLLWIDGYSRMIVYLQCTVVVSWLPKNPSTQKEDGLISVKHQMCAWKPGMPLVFMYFWKATREFDVPSHACSDKGEENIMVCYTAKKCRVIFNPSVIVSVSISIVL